MAVFRIEETRDYTVMSNHHLRNVGLSLKSKVNTPPETVPLDRTNGAARPLKWCMVTADMVH